MTPLSPDQQLSAASLLVTAALTFWGTFNGSFVNITIDNKSRFSLLAKLAISTLTAALTFCLVLLVLIKIYGLPTLLPKIFGDPAIVHQDTPSMAKTSGSENDLRPVPAPPAKPTKPSLVDVWFQRGFNSGTRKEIPIVISAPEGDIYDKDKRAELKLSQMMAPDFNIVSNKVDAAISIELSNTVSFATPTGGNCAFPSRSSVWAGQARVTARITWAGGKDIPALESFASSLPGPFSACEEKAASDAALEAVLGKIKEGFVTVSDPTRQAN